MENKAAGCSFLGTKMQNKNHILSASDRLRQAIFQELKKTEYGSIRGTAEGTHKAAVALKRNRPEVFDLNNPTDRLVWAMAGD